MSSTLSSRASKAPAEPAGHRVSRETLILEAQHLTVRHGGRLEDVGFRLEPGQLVGLIGPNGAGKTTLLRCLAGALVPQGGVVLADGAPLLKMNGQERSRQVAWLPQSTPTPFGYTVRERVALAARSTEAVASALRATGLEHHAERAVTRLSGGERRRSALAATLAQDARCLLLDEPVAALDLGQALTTMRHLEAIARQGRTVLVALHDLRLAARWPDRTLLLHEGRLVADATPQELLDDPVLEAVYGVTGDDLRAYLTFS